MASPSSPPTHALRPRRRCSARPPSPLPSLVLLSFPLPRPTPSAAEQQRIPLGVRVSFFSVFFLSGWLIMCCTLMGRRRAAFSRPFARPLASRLTDPTPRIHPQDAVLFPFAHPVRSRSLATARAYTPTHLISQLFSDSNTYLLSQQAPRLLSSRPLPFSRFHTLPSDRTSL